MNPNWPHYRPPHPAQPPHTGHPGQPGPPSTQMAAYGQSGSPPHPSPTPTAGPPPPYAWASPYPSACRRPSDVAQPVRAATHGPAHARPGVHGAPERARGCQRAVGARSVGGRAAPRACLCTRKCPGRELRMQLAQRLHVKPRQVRVWFQNKRQRTKNRAKAHRRPSPGARRGRQRSGESDPCGAWSAATDEHRQLGRRGRPRGGTGAPEGAADAKDTPADAERRRPWAQPSVVARPRSRLPLPTRCRTASCPMGAIARCAPA